MSGYEEQNLKIKNLYYNGKIYTQSNGIVVDSMVICKNRIIAVGNNLQHDPDFKAYNKIDLKGRTVIPGLVDAHTHFYFMALSLGRVSLDGVDTIEKCLNKIKKFSATLGKNEWVVGDGFSADRLKKYVLPDKTLLDKVTGGRPAFIFSRDQHLAWVNSKALELAGINGKTRQPKDGQIDHDINGEPTGILREGGAYGRVYDLVKSPSKERINQLYQQALELAYSRGVTGVHSFDSPEAFQYFAELAEKGKLGLRINYYFPAVSLPILKKHKIFYGMGDDFLRVAGIKIFSDGALGSQTALCFKNYPGTKNNGIATKTAEQMHKEIKTAISLGLPSAIHAIGDKAIDNVLTAFENLPQLHFGARHRIEHLQLIRRKDIKRVKDMNIIASMQPSQCPSDISIMRKYWPTQNKNAYIFRTLIDKNIPLAFGSDAPIEPLHPLDSIAAAVRRAKPRSNDVFNPEEKITIEEALYNFTAGPAFAVGQEHCRGYLMPGYPADFVVLSDDILKTAPSKLYDLKVLATVLDGKVKYSKISL